MSLGRKLRRLIALPTPEKAFLAEAIWQLAKARIMTAALPFGAIAAKLEQAAGADEDPDRTGQCLVAVRLAARHVPFRAVCFQQSLALHAMLARRGISSRLHYGLGHAEDGTLRAHVWTSVAGRTILGGEGSDMFSELASFPPRDGMDREPVGTV